MREKGENEDKIQLNSVENFATNNCQSASCIVKMPHNKVNNNNHDLYKKCRANCGVAQANPNVREFHNLCYFTKLG